MPNQTLRSRLIRLADEQPELRPHLLPLLSRTAAQDASSLMSDLVRDVQAANAETGDAIHHAEMVVINTKKAEKNLAALLALLPKLAKALGL
jgi:hypothetical protein